MHSCMYRLYLTTGAITSSPPNAGIRHLSMPKYHWREIACDTMEGLLQRDPQQELDRSLSGVSSTTSASVSRGSQAFSDHVPLQHFDR